MLTIYTLSTCDSCRKATRWLRNHAIAVEEKAIRQTPPSGAELRAMLVHQRGELRRLFNTSGQEYRADGLKERLATLGEDEAIAMLAGNGSLVKRPFLIGPRVGLVGFDPDVWEAALI